MIGLDPMYFVFLAPAMLLGFWAQARVKWAIAQGNQISASAGITGAEVAQRILDSYHVRGVGIERLGGRGIGFESSMGDHYDPKAKVLRLSEDVYSGRSISSLGIAAHEVGHAIQDATNYAPLILRNGIVPLASFGSNLSYILMFLGAALGMFNLILLGIVAFSLIVVFQLVNLPVEFDASNRARAILLKDGIISASEEKEVGKVLNAAAMTYVAATVTSVLTLLYYLYRFGVIGGSKNSDD